jgi:hypothetical protein
MPCGKTTILDAIAAALGPGTGLSPLRPGFALSPRRVVRRGALNSKVTCWLRFSQDEIAATRELFKVGEVDEDVPDVEQVQLTWIYPDPRKPPETTMWSGYSGGLPSSTAVSISSGPVVHSGPMTTVGTLSSWIPNAYISATPQPPLPQGYREYEPQQGRYPLTGRFVAAQLLSTSRAGWPLYDRVGAVFTFDQERTGLGKTISRQVWNIIHGTTESARDNEDLRATDPRTILIDLALQSLVPSSVGEKSDAFRLIQERYRRVCAPREIVGPVRDDLGEFEISFRDGEYEYTYEGLSSGEKNVLLLLIRFVDERIHNSIVLIDELELNQHPIWQRKLLSMIPQMGNDNQIIATTHSPYLRDAVRPDAVIDLGDLDDYGSHEAD